MFLNQICATFISDTICSNLIIVIMLGGGGVVNYFGILLKNTHMTSGYSQTHF